MCDVGMFSAGKSSWKKVVNKWKSESGNKILNEVEAVKLLKNVNDSFIKRESIINGFKVTGIHPFNVENVMFDRCYGSSSSPGENIALPDDPALPDDSALFDDPALPDDFALFDDLALPDDPALPEDSALFEDLELQNMVTPEESVVLQDIATSEVISALDTIQQHLKNTIMPYMVKNHHDVSGFVLAMKHQLSVIRNVAGNSPPIPQQTEPAHSSVPSSLTVPTIRNILKVPSPYKRAERRRNYKLANFGVLTDIALLNKIQADNDKKKQDETIKATIRNIKKENAEKRKAESLEKKTKKHFEQQQKEQEKSRKCSETKVNDENEIPNKTKRGRPPKNRIPAGVSGTDTGQKLLVDNFHQNLTDEAQTTVNTELDFNSDPTTNFRKCKGKFKRHHDADASTDKKPVDKKARTRK